GDGPVHQLGRNQVGPRLRPGAVPAARLRRAGPGAFLRAARALPPALRRAQHPGLRAEQRGADLPPAAPADAAPVPQAADRDDAEIVAAQEGSGVVDRGAGQRLVPDGDSGYDDGGRKGREARHRLLRQGLLRLGFQKNRTPKDRYGNYSRRAALSVPAQAVRSADEALPERDRSGVVPGRAAEPGRVVPDRALLPRKHARRPEAVLCRPSAFGFASRWLHGEAQRAAEDAGGTGFREVQVVFS